MSYFTFPYPSEMFASEKKSNIPIPFLHLSFPPPILRARGRQTNILLGEKGARARVKQRDGRTDGRQIKASLEVSRCRPGCFSQRPPSSHFQFRLSPDNTQEALQLQCLRFKLKVHHLRTCESGCSCELLPEKTIGTSSDSDT